MLVGDHLYAPLAAAAPPSPPAPTSMRAFWPIHIGDFPPEVFSLLVIDTHTVEDYHMAFVYRVDTNTPEPRHKKEKATKKAAEVVPNKPIIVQEARIEALDSLFENRGNVDRLEALDFLFKHAKIEKKNHDWE